MRAGHRPAAHHFERLRTQSWLYSFLDDTWKDKPVERMNLNILMGKRGPILNLDNITSRVCVGVHTGVKHLCGRKSLYNFFLWVAPQFEFRTVFKVCYFSYYHQSITDEEIAFDPAVGAARIVF